MADVYLHVGLPKTGTTYLQRVLWQGRSDLAAAGVLYPGDQRMTQTFAVWDLLGRRPRGADQPEVSGAWSGLVEQVRGWTGSHTLVSEELLALARPRQARRVVEAFAPGRVHVVVTVRDLGRVVAGSWQQELAKGNAWSFEDYLAAVRDPEHGAASAGVGFWLRQDVVRVCDIWARAVSWQRLHLVTVPPAGTAQEQLLDRFARAARLPLAVLPADQPGANPSVGLAEAEVLRRLNTRLGGRLNERQYVHVVHRSVREPLQDRPSAVRIPVPDEYRGWLTERATSTARTLRERGVDVVGDLEDLLPAGRHVGDGLAGTPTGPTGPSEADVADAALDALTGAVSGYAEFWWRQHRTERRAAAGTGTRVASATRAGGFRVRLAALRLADRSRVVRWLANRYLHRTSPHS